MPGTVMLLRAVDREEEAQTGTLRRGPADGFDALRVTGLTLLPVTLLVSAYLVAHGHLSRGGGFQGGVLVSRRPAASRTAARRRCARSRLDSRPGRCGRTGRIAAGRRLPRGSGGGAFIWASGSFFA
ncbi:hypothetical protein GCM10022214_04340 [Actinomadura miaoliensis]|uniref:Na+/H+ antiporter MnhB subunit-related protein domain-containing protein n=1 Tax=Actinomadura miaoliensis TaxID=430685 RepID=A0ABP7UZD9_9ACTN